MLLDKVVVRLLLADEVFELFTSGERRNGLRRNLEFFASLWVTADTGVTLARFERSETNQGYFLTFGNGFLDRTNQSGENLSHLLLWVAGFLCYFLYEFFFIHDNFLLILKRAPRNV